MNKDKENKDKEVKKSWNNYYKIFKKKEKNEHLWRIIESYIDTKGKILDLGCGPGSYSELIKKKNKKLFSIDISKECLKNMENAVVGDCQNLPFSSSTFQTIIMLTTLQYASDPRKTINEAERVLQKGGCLILTVPTKYSIQTLKRKLSILLNRYKLYPNIIHFAPLMLKKLLRQHNFKIELITGYEFFSEKSAFLKFEKKMPDWLLSNFSYHIICVARKL